MRIKSWTVLNAQAETLTIFDRAERSQRYLDTLLIVPADVGIHLGDELFNRDGLPVMWVEELCFQSAEEAVARGVVLRTAFRDIERTSCALLILLSQPEGYNQVFLRILVFLRHGSAVSI